jgi:hypothetical protein
MSASPWIRNPGPKTPVTGLKTAVSTDSAVVTETMRQVLREGGNAADAGAAGALLQAAVEPFMTHHAGTVTYLDHDAATGRHHPLHSGHPVSTFEHGVFGAMEHVELAAGGGAAGRPTLDRLAADAVAQLKSWDATVRAVPGCDHRVGS